MTTETKPKTTEGPASGHSLHPLVRCCGCDELFHPDDLNTVDVENYGLHETIEVCDACIADPDQAPLTDADLDETHWTEAHGTADGGGS